MKSLTHVLLVCIASLTICNGQYSPTEPDSIQLDEYSRTELRKLFLEMKENTEVYQLAKKSRSHTRWSIVFYSIGALSTFIGLEGLSNMDSGGYHNVSPGIAAIGLGGGLAGFSLGVWQTLESQKKIDKALDLYTVE